MSALPIAKTEDLTEEQKAQHIAVLKTTSFNLSTIIDSIETLDHALYNDVLDCLDSARVILNELQGIEEPETDG